MEISEERFTALEQKLDLTYRAADKTRKYILATLIISVVVFIIPLIGVMVVAPMALDSLTGTYNLEGL